MAIIHLAIDQVAGLTLPSGEIKGLSDSVQGLRDANFDATAYTGNRLSMIDDASAGWDSDVVPGWFLVGAAVQPFVPLTDLDELKNDIKAFQSQVSAWSEELSARGVAQKPTKVTQGQERLRNALGAAYLICRDTNHSAANRKIWVTNMRTGALQIQTVDDFYATDTADFPPAGQTVGEPGDANSRWYCWVNITAPATKLLLTASVFVTGNVPTDVNLLDPAWVDAIPA